MTARAGLIGRMDTIDTQLSRRALGTHPNPLAGEDVKKYRELYDAVNQVTS